MAQGVAHPQLIHDHLKGALQPLLLAHDLHPATVREEHMAHAHAPQHATLEVHGHRQLDVLTGVRSEVSEVRQQLILTPCGVAWPWSEAGGEQPQVVPMLDRHDDLRRVCAGGHTQASMARKRRPAPPREGK